MYPLSRAEIKGCQAGPFLPDKIKMPKTTDMITGLFEKIYRSGMPQMVIDANLSSEDYFGAYMQTYLERDIRDLITIKDDRFLRFLSCAAARNS